MRHAAAASHSSQVVADMPAVVPHSRIQPADMVADHHQPDHRGGSCSSPSWRSAVELDHIYKKWTC